MALFQGYQKAFGVFYPSGKIEPRTNKVLGRAATERGTPTAQRFEGHLLGQTGLGIVMLREDDTCHFGAIDYDVPEMDHAAFAQKLTAAGLPLVLCRSKSGGGHFYLFSEAPLPAIAMVKRLQLYAATLNITTSPNGQRTEIFPKQITRVLEQDIGNWINLPYWSALAEPGTDRPAFDAEGKALDFTAGLAFMESRKLSSVSAPVALPVVTGSLFEDGPPCLQALEAQGGFPQGSRNNGIFNVAVYLRKRYGDEWENQLYVCNTKLANLPPQELNKTVISSNKKKSFSYLCSQPPISSVCQREECLRRRYGVKSGAPGQGVHSLGGVTKLVPDNEFDAPLWRIEINGTAMLLSHDELINRDAFNRAALARLNLMPVTKKKSDWEEEVEDLAQSADVQVLVEGSTPYSALWLLTLEFLTQTAVSLTREELLESGKPYYEGGKVWFTLNTLHRFIEERGKKVLDKFTELLKSRGAEVETWNPEGGGSPRSVWSFPEPRRAVDLTDLSRVEGREPF